MNKFGYLLDGVLYTLTVALIAVMVTILALAIGGYI
jgi:hypothetical protein